MTTHPAPGHDTESARTPGDDPDAVPDVALDDESGEARRAIRAGRAWRLVADISVFRRPAHTIPADQSGEDTTTEATP